LQLASALASSLFVVQNFIYCRCAAKKTHISWPLPVRRLSGFWPEFLQISLAPHLAVLLLVFLADLFVD